MRATVLCIVIGIIAVSGWAAHTASAGDNPERIASQIVAACRGADDRAACYEKEVPSLYPRLTVARVFDVVRALRVQDPSYQFCHVLGHRIGETVVALDPARWIDAIPFNPPDSLCSNGYIHGIIGGRFERDVLTDAQLKELLPDFKRACEAHDEWHPTDLDRAMCYHAMGHLYDFITLADLPTALGLCNATVDPDYRRVCYGGVFMQIFQPLEPADQALIAQLPLQPTAKNIPQFCGNFKNPAYVGACIAESWPLFQKGVIDGTGVESFCSMAPDAAEKDACYESATAIIGHLSLGKPEQALRACRALPDARKAGCLAVAAQAIIEEDRTDIQSAIDLCRSDAAIAGHCIATLVDHASFIFGAGSDDLAHFCAIAPPEFAARCGGR